jgi:hypothetical protein
MKNISILYGDWSQLQNITTVLNTFFSYLLAIYYKDLWLSTQHGLQRRLIQSTFLTT